MTTQPMGTYAPKTIRHYLLSGVLGKGASGVVYRALDTRANREVAIKVLRGRAREGGKIVEPSLLSSLNHPHILRLQDFFVHRTDIVLVFEYIDGGTLEDYLLKHGGRLSHEETKLLLSQLLAALQHAHENLIEHLDIKPQNILVGVDTQGMRRFVLADFGVGRMRSGVMLTGKVVGTYAYMAPEQLRGRPAASSDIWSLAVVAYLCLAGVRPFGGMDTKELSRCIFFKHPDPPSHHASLAGGPLDAVILRMLEKNSWERGTAAELLTMLREGAQSAVTPDPSHKCSWELDMETRLRRRYVWMTALISIMSLPLVIPMLLVLAGAWLIYSGYEKSRKASIAGGLGLTLAASVAEFFGIGLLTAWVGTRNIESYVTLKLFLINLPIAVILARLFLTAETIKRELFFVRTIKRRRSSEQLIAYVRDYLDVHHGDVQVHQYYVDCLLQLRRHREAVVEAKLILRQDPANFSASLSLAHAYLSLGLIQECRQVCLRYLDQAGHCFEFRQLLAETEAARGV